MFNIEPKRNNKIESLNPIVQTKVKKILELMRLKGFDPIIFEARRTSERQKWLYGVGRTHSKNRKPITWTLKSNHFSGNAVDVISKKRGWNWPEFYDCLDNEARKVGMKTIPKERCHIEI